METSRLDFRDKLTGFVISLSVFIVGILGVDAYQHSDMWGTLLAAQSLLDHGTVALDDYPPEVLEEAQYSWQVIEVDGHKYTAYPPGNALFSLPAVAIANDVLGLDMQVPAEQLKLQGFLAALTTALIVFLIYLIARHFLDRRVALVTTLILAFGTSIISTLGVALWNFNYVCLFLLYVLYLLLTREEKLRGVHFAGISILLWCAYITRPSAAVFIAPFMVYMVLRHRRYFLQITLPAGLLFIGTVVYSYAQFDYYYPSVYRTSELTLTTFWTAVYGHTFSPSRGLFIYSPFFLLVAVYFILGAKKFFSNWLNVTVFVWLALHTLMMCLWLCWWGGGGFGYRILSDGLPAYAYITIWVTKYAIAHHSLILRKSYLIGQPILGLFAIYVHSYEGLFNEWQYKFHWDFRADSNLPDIYLDWDYSQIGFREADYWQRHEQYADEYPFVLVTGFLTPVRDVSWDGREQPGFELGQGWSEQEPWGRWSNRHMADAYVDMEQSDSDHAVEFRGHLFPESSGFHLYFNNHYAGPMDFWRGRIPVIQSEWIQDGRNKVTIVTHHLTSPKEAGISEDWRMLGFAARQMVIHRIAGRDRVPH